MKCLICGKEHSNKKYCSEKCQYEAYKIKKVERVNIKCLNCGEEFETLKTKPKKYCSRKCVDEHKKITYLGENNPMFNVKVKEETKIKHSLISKELWKNPIIANKIKDGIKERNKNSDYPNGWSPESRDKRKKTYEKIYNDPSLVEIMKNKRDNTCLKKYGKTSYDIMNDALLKTSKTKIENMFEEYLKEKNIDYKNQHKIYYKIDGNLKYKIYDFIINDKILIEIDGDYWHGNSQFFKVLNETQLKNKENDDFKNELAKMNNMTLIRFWENEIINNKYKEILNKWLK